MKFIIKKGTHYSNETVFKLKNFFNTNNTLQYQVVFDDSCVYELPKEDQGDINKLFGFSIGFNHHKNSARFGWSYQDGKINLHAYIYDNGVRKSKLIDKLNFNSSYLLTLTDLGEEWKFSVENGSNITELKMSKLHDFEWGYKLWPYFGGNNPAPHDITIDLI